MNLAEKFPDLQLSMLSADGELALAKQDGRNCLFYLAGETPETPLLMRPRILRFSPCNKWVLHSAGFYSTLNLYRVSDLKAGISEYQEFEGCHDATFAPDGSVIGIDVNGLFRLTEDRDGFFNRSTLAKVRFTAVGMSIYDSKVYVEDSHSKGHLFHVFTLDGERLPDTDMVPLALNIGKKGGQLCDWNRTPIVLEDKRDAEIFSAGHMQGDVLKEWIKYNQMTVTWDRSGLTLPKKEGSVTVMWPPIAKLLEPAEAYEYRLRCAANPGFFKEFGMTLDEVADYFDAFNSIHGAHQGLWDAYECVQQADQTPTLTESKSQALAALGRARSTSDEPALSQELPTALVSSLCHADRLAFRHHEPDACKYVKSILGLVLVSNEKPSDPWCSEEAVNLALGQCAKPAAHAQRAALRLGVELRDDLLVPRFRKLVTHTTLEGAGGTPLRAIDFFRSQRPYLLSPIGDIEYYDQKAFSLRTGARLPCEGVLAFSPCGKWAFTHSYGTRKLEVLSVDDLLRGVRQVVFEKEFNHRPTFKFVDDTTFFTCAEIQEEYQLCRGTLQPDGSFTLASFDGPSRGNSTLRKTFHVFEDRVCFDNTFYDFSGNEIGHCEGIPITQEVAIDANARARGTVLASYDGRKLATVDMVCHVERIFNSRFLRPSVLADLIKLIGERITWSDKGISLPTTDGKTFTFWWEPVRELSKVAL